MMDKNPILDDLTYEQSSGSLLYNGVRYLLIRPETIAGFQKGLVETHGEDVNNRLFDGGYTGGSLSAKKYRDILGFDGPGILGFMLRMGSEIGWGKFVLDEFDADSKSLGIVVENSPFAEAYGDSTSGVCHLIRGVIAGLASVLFEESCTVDEVECRAKGDKWCRFVTGTK